ncbi:MAG: DUF2269 domain-containing protein [Spirochaetes bacterium]|nr:DUF2269 domain-containing protein [Spirochaetota bacterium]MBU1081564.1 DUF2269 domain-containing protein [Spirochaetota bacterium]
MKTKRVLYLFLAIMAALVVAAALYKDAFMAALDRPELYGHARFAHIAAATIFFANAVVGMLWERRALAVGSKEAVLHTYETVAWLDARLSSPLIVVSLVAGLVMAAPAGDVFEQGWLSWAFALFLFSGAFWVLSDIPTQYRVKRLTAALDPADPVLPAELVRLLRLRWWISLAGVAPLVAVFALMVYKPAVPALAGLFR